MRRILFLFQSFIVNMICENAIFSTRCPRKAEMYRNWNKQFANAKRRFLERIVTRCMNFVRKCRQK